MKTAFISLLVIVGGIQGCDMYIPDNLGKSNKFNGQSTSADPVVKDGESVPVQVPVEAGDAEFGTMHEASLAVENRSVPDGLLDAFDFDGNGELNPIELEHLLMSQESESMEAYSSRGHGKMGYARGEKDRGPRREHGRRDRDEDRDMFDRGHQLREQLHMLQCLDTNKDSGISKEEFERGHADAVALKACLSEKAKEKPSFEFLVKCLDTNKDSLVSTAEIIAGDKDPLILKCLKDGQSAILP